MRLILKEITNFDSVPVNDSKRSFYLAILLYALLLPLKLVFVPNDHAGYLEFMSEAQSLSGIADPEAKGKLWVALIYGYIDSLIPYEVLTSLVFIFYIYIVNRHAKSKVAIIFHVLLIAPLSPYFGYITKEALLLMVMVFSYGIGRVYPRLVLILFYLLMGFFAIFVRQYYLPFLFLAFLYPRTGFRTKFLGLSSLIVFLILFGDSIFKTLYYIKEDMWVRLKYYSVVNTLFPLEIDQYNNFFDFIYVWLQNLLYLFTTIIWSFGLNGIASIVNLVLVILAFYQARNLGVRDIYLFSFYTLIFMTFLVPDSGTFVRHATLLTIVMYFSIFSAGVGKSVRSK